MPMTINRLIDHLTTIRDAHAPNGDAEVFMVTSEDETLPVECPVMIGNELCLYSEALF